MPSDYNTLILRCFFNIIFFYGETQIQNARYFVQQEIRLGSKEGGNELL